MECRYGRQDQWPPRWKIKMDNILICQPITRGGWRNLRIGNGRATLTIQRPDTQWLSQSDTRAPKRLYRRYFKAYKSDRGWTYQCLAKHDCAIEDRRTGDTHGVARPVGLVPGCSLGVHLWLKMPESVWQPRKLASAHFGARCCLPISMSGSCEQALRIRKGDRT